MSSGPILDTDIVLKVSAYQLSHEALEIFRQFGVPLILGLSRIVIPKQFTRQAGRLRNPHHASDHIDALLAGLESIEPDEVEVRIAAELEEAAMSADLPLDQGEAQVFAVSVCRALPLVLTGDKRAITCLSECLALIGKSGACHEKVATLEHVMLTLIELHEFDAVRQKICSEVEVDTALRICFSCNSEEVNGSSVVEGLTSYLEEVAAHSSGVVFPCKSLCLT